MINEQCCIVGISTSLIHPKILCLRWRWMPSFLRQWFSKFRVWVIFLAVTFLSLCDFSCFHTKPFKYFSKLREGSKKCQVEKHTFDTLSQFQTEKMNSLYMSTEWDPPRPTTIIEPFHNYLEKSQNRGWNLDLLCIMFSKKWPTCHHSIPLGI